MRALRNAIPGNVLLHASVCFCCSCQCWSCCCIQAFQCIWVMQPDQNFLSYVMWLTNREVGPQEPEALLHERVRAESTFPRTLQLVPRNRSFHYMKQRSAIRWVSRPRRLVPRNRSFCYTERQLLEFATQEPVFWFRGTDCFATQNLHFLNL